MCISPTDALMGVCACARVLISLHCNKRTNPSNLSARPKGQNQHPNPGTPFFHFSQATWSFQTRPKAHDQPKECATSLSRVLWAKSLKLLSPPEHRPCISSRTSLFLPGTRNTSSSKCLAVTETILLLERNKDPEGGLFPSKRDAPERRLLQSAGTPAAEPRHPDGKRTQEPSGGPAQGRFPDALAHLVLRERGLHAAPAGAAKANHQEGAVFCVPQKELPSEAEDQVSRQRQMRRQRRARGRSRGRWLLRFGRAPAFQALAEPQERDVVGEPALPQLPVTRRPLGGRHLERNSSRFWERSPPRRVSQSATSTSRLQPISEWVSPSGWAHWAGITRGKPIYSAAE